MARQGETCTLVKLFLILKEKIDNYYGSHKGKNYKRPFHFLSPMCKMYSKSVCYFMILHGAEFGRFFSWIRPTYFGSVIIYYSF